MSNNQPYKNQNKFLITERSLNHILRPVQVRKCNYPYTYRIENMDEEISVTTDRAWTSSNHLILDYRYSRLGKISMKSLLISFPPVASFMCKSIHITRPQGMSMINRSWSTSSSLLHQHLHSLIICYGHCDNYCKECATHQTFWLIWLERWLSLLLLFFFELIYGRN